MAPLLLSLIFISTLNSISAIQNTTEFIKTSCSTTTYPTLCYTSLSTRATVIKTSPKLLAKNALTVTLETTKLTSAMILRLSKTHDMSPREAAAMQDCMELLSDSVDSLKNSVEEMSQPGSKDYGLVMSDIQTWVSAALTNEDTCTEGFTDRSGSLKNVVRGKIVNVAHLTSNALALVNRYVSLRS